MSTNPAESEVFRQQSFTDLLAGHNDNMHIHLCIFIKFKCDTRLLNVYMPNFKIRGWNLLL